MAELAQGQLIDQVHVHTGGAGQNNGSYTVRWTFHQIGGTGADCRIGQWYDGSYWICPATPGATIVIDNSVLQVNANPADVFDGGMEIDPVPSNPPITLGSTQLQGFVNVNNTGYTAARNLMGSLPYTVPAGDHSLVKAVNDDNTTVRKQGTDVLGVTFYSVLTVLTAPPADGVGGSNTLRPPFAGTIKRQFNVSEFDLTQLPSNALLQTAMGVTDATVFAGVAQRWSSPFVDHFIAANDYYNFLTPSWLKCYGADDESTWLNDAYTVCGTSTLAAKTNAAFALIQRGMELYYSYKNQATWIGGAGQNLGRLPAIEFFGTLCTDAAIKADITAITKSNFQEGVQLRVIPYESGGANIPVWGDNKTGTRGYWQDMANWRLYITAPNNTPLSGAAANQSHVDPYGWIDGSGHQPGSNYQTCCSTGPYIGHALLLKIFPAMQAISNNRTLIDYVWRYVNYGTRVTPDIVAPISATDAANTSLDVYHVPGNAVDYGTLWGDSATSPGTPIKISGAQIGRYDPAAGYAGYANLNRVPSFAAAYFTNNGFGVLNTNKLPGLVVAGFAYIIIPAAQQTVANAVFKALDPDSGGSNTFKRGASASGVGPATYYVAAFPGNSLFTTAGISYLLNHNIELKAIVNDAYTKRSLGTAPTSTDMDNFVATFTGGTSWVTTSGTLAAFLNTHSLILI